MTYDLVNVVLALLIVAQNIFWAKICLNLTNRIMSRNYAELVQADRAPTDLRPLPEETIDPMDERQAKEINSLMGMV